MGSHLKLAFLLCTMLVVVSVVQAQKVVIISGSTSEPAAEAIPESPPKPDPELDKVSAEARALYLKALDLYMANKYTEMKDSLLGQAKVIATLTPTLKTNLNYMKSSAVDFRPPWWKSCRSSSNISFPAKIWDKQFMANFVPSEDLGEQMPIDYNERTQKFTIIVSWRPNYIDNDKPLKGEQAVRHKLSQGDLGEVIAWHELGHNYITNFLPGKTVMDMYNNHQMMFNAAQEFYADMTAMYHCTPHGRLACMCMRTDDIESGQDSGLESHHRAAYAIGAILVTNFLQDPSKWPSVHLPGVVPSKKPELNTVVYVYDHFAASLTLAEDRALRELVRKFLFANGAAILPNKGAFPLASKLPFNLMENDDRDLVGKRDAWVAAQIKKAIAAGQADKPPKITTKPSGDDEEENVPFWGRWHRSRVVIPW